MVQWLDFPTKHDFELRYRKESFIVREYYLFWLWIEENSYEGLIKEDLGGLPGLNDDTLTLSYRCFVVLSRIIGMLEKRLRMVGLSLKNPNISPLYFYKQVFICGEKSDYIFVGEFS